MKKPYNLTAGFTQRLRQLGFTALLAGGATVAAHAQALNYTPALTTNVAGTYTDLGTAGVAIATANTDDANSAAQDIGFSFSYNGTTFTQFVLNTNGLIRLGASAPSSAAAHSTYAQTPELGPANSTNAADVNLIMPFNIDLVAGTATAGASYRVAVTGTAPNRVCTIQWSNVSDKATDASSTVAVSITPQIANISFQVKLYETSNQIEFVYGPTTAGTGASNTKYVAVGLKGSGSASGQTVLGTKLSTAAWSGTTFFTGPYVVATSGNAHNVRQTAMPDAGRTYRFTQAVANDAAVFAVYTLGKLPTAALPHAIQAVIANFGTAAQTNLPVTLSVTGANTFTNTQTVASLAAGGGTLVTFAALPTTLVAGVNTVTVTVPSDGNTTNNSIALQQTVNSGTTFSYIPTNQTNTPLSTTGGLGANTPANGIIYAAKYTTVAAGTVTSVSAFIQDVNTVGKTLYGVVLSPTGSILAQSANYVVQASDINTYHTFSITTPPAIAANGSFLAGMAQAAQSASIFPMGIQSEPLGRPGTFYLTGLTGGTLNDVNATSDYRFMIEASVSTALTTSPELMRAVTVYPNPSATGVFNLAINGANAQKGLQVEVVNTLGQRVYTGSARDNFTTTLDLSNLANGLYHLKIKNGDEYMQRQISVVK